MNKNQETKQATPAAVAQSLNVIANLIFDVAKIDNDARRLESARNVKAIARDVKESAKRISQFQTIGVVVLDNVKIVVDKLPARVFPGIDRPTTAEAWEDAPAEYKRLVGACDRFATFKVE